MARKSVTVTTPGMQRGRTSTSAMPFVPPGPTPTITKQRKVAGRPKAIEGETLVVQAGEMLRSAVQPTQGGVYFLPIDEILHRKGWRTYQDMRHDDQVKATLAFKKVLVGGRNWEIKPADQSAKAKEIAAFVDETFKRFNFKKALKGAMTAFEYGFSAGEIVWGADDYNGERKIMIEDIKHRDPQSIDIAQDDYGNIVAFRQRHAWGLVEVEPEKIWHYGHQSEFGNPYGYSDLRSAYRSWWAKKFIINFWNVFMERMGSPMTLMHYPLGADETLKTLLKGILTNLSSKTEILVPEGVTVELVEATRSGKADYEQALDWHNNSIARSMLMVGLIGLQSGAGTSGRGADSQSRLQLRILFKMADEISREIIDSLQRQVIKRLVDMNYDAGGVYPKFEFHDYGEFEGIEVIDTIRQLHVGGAIDLDQDDVNYIRTVTGLPLRNVDNGDKPDDVIRPPAPPPVGGGMGGAGPPPPESGNSRAEKGVGAAGRKTEPGTTDEKPA